MSLLNFIAAFNREMEQTAREMAAEGKNVLVSQLSGAGTDALENSLRKRTGKEAGVIRRVGISFERHGYYLEHGAGRGQGGRVGSRWKDPQGRVRTTNTASLGKANSGNRRAKKFIEPTLKKYEVIVADRAQDLVGDLGLQMVLGVFDTKIRI